MTQCIDLGLQHAEIETYLVQSGYWGTPARKARNAFVLSPCAYALDTNQRHELNVLAKGVYACAEYIAQRLHEITHSTSITHEEAFFARLTWNATRGLLSPREHDGSIPPILKVDLMQTTENRYQIAEVDVYNPRGFGYLALLDALVPDKYLLPGPGLGHLAQLLKKFCDGNPLSLIVSAHERYYLPSFEVLASGLRQRGVEVHIVHEEELGTGAIAVDSLSHIFIIPESLYVHSDVRVRLLQRVQNGTTHVFYPPAAYLGSKAFLPTYGAYRGLGHFVPTSALVSKVHNPFKTFDPTASTVLKGVVSSGHKHVIFKNRSPLQFEAALNAARKIKNPTWVMQSEVAQQPLPVVVFSRDGNRVVRNYYMRLTAYVARDGLVGIEATGREDGFVHGATDCIQIPCICM